MKKRIIITIMLIVSIIVGSVCVYNKVNKQKIETNNIVDEKNKEEEKSDLIEDEKDKNDIETTISIIDEEKQNKVIIEESKPSNKKSDNNNSTSNSNKNNQVVENKTPVTSQPVQNTEPVVENPTPPTPAAPSCTPKKFINSWFVGEFSSQQACLDAGEKYMFDYSVSCPYLDDDCGTTYWMLQLIDRNGNIVDYHTVN